MTPEERRAIFADVQASSKAAKEKRKKTMAATISDTVAEAKAETKPKAEMAATVLDQTTTPEKSKMSTDKKGVIGNILKKRKMLEETLDY